MQRQRSEALQLTSIRHNNLSDRNFQLLTTHYTRVQDWACGNCGNTGTSIRITNGEIRTFDCMCRMVHDRKMLQQKMIAESNIPERYHDASVERWKNPGRDKSELDNNSVSFNIVTKYAHRVTAMIQKGIGLYLCGPNGVGKTYLACAIANHAAAAGLDVRYYTMAAIVRTQIDGWFNDESKATVKGFRSAKLLIIDDVDKIYKTKTGIETSVFDNLLRDRLQANMPCLFTSNRSMDDAKEDYGPHIHSMLSEHCGELIFMGADYRVNMSDKIKRDILGS
tara:strand:+ start:1271 stop:2110 length:840 start_codon:yes stop_codon:yes gene_type:complete